MLEERDGEGIQDDGGEAQGAKEEIRVVEDFSGAIRIIEEVMGWWHAYYAKHSKSVGGRGIVISKNGAPAGALVFYESDLVDVRIGVIYYVAVLRGYRGRGLGKILVLAAEHLMSESDMYVATLESGNTSSRRMFEGLCYREYTWAELESISGELAEAIYRSTCAYEDDMVMVKGSLDRITITRRALKIARKIWDKACYRPWRMMWKP